MNRILPMDPNVRERSKLRRALTLEGFSVRAARDSREAVRSSRVGVGCPSPTNHDAAPKAARGQVIPAPTRPKPDAGQN